MTTKYTAMNILHMTKKDRRRKAVVAIKHGVTVTDGVTEMAWSVVRLAVLDIGWFEKTKVLKKDLSYQTVIDRHKDSTNDIKGGGLDFWCEVLNLDKTYVFRVLKHFKLLV